MCRFIRLDTVRMALPRGCIAVYRAQQVVYRALSGVYRGVSGLTSGVSSVYFRFFPLGSGMRRCIRLETVRIALPRGCIAVYRPPKWCIGLPRGCIAVYRAQKLVYPRCILLGSDILRCIRLDKVRIALLWGCIAVYRARKVVYRAPAWVYRGVSSSTSGVSSVYPVCN
jgi:hypothetical protein